MDRNVTLSVRSLLVAGLVALAVVAAYLVGRAGPAPASAETADGASPSRSPASATSRWCPTSSRST